MRKRSGSTGQRNKGLTKGYKLLPTLFIFLLILVWQGYVVLNKVPRFILPEPIMVLRALYEERSLLLTHTLVTLMEAAIGFGLSVLLSCLFGVVMGYFELVRRIFYPIFILSQTIPLIVMAPLFAIWFGFGLFPKILIVVLVCFFPITVSFAQGLIKPDEDMDDLLCVMGASRWKTFLLTRVPQALPGLFSGLKIAATYSVMGAAISEWVGADKGLGIYMTIAMTSFKTPVLFADILVIILLSIGLYKLIEAIEYRVTRHIRPTD